MFSRITLPQAEIKRSYYVSIVDHIWVDLIHKLIRLRQIMHEDDIFYAHLDYKKRSYCYDHDTTVRLIDHNQLI